MDSLLESNWSYSGCCIGVGHELSMIFSNAKDEVWSQHKHLHELKDLTETEIDLNFQGIYVL